ncbi:MAG TPA: RICIN domain-containing protein [Thermoanaerobaculia bacterium]|nr:RICIN domain-containing protein [Thermoanaerobaculia bacterium]
MRILGASPPVSSSLSFTRLLVTIVSFAAGLSLFLVNGATAQDHRDSYYRLQLKVNGQYLDADHCSTRISLNPGSSYDGGACQLWRLVPAGDGWSRIQLKVNGQYLDADHCSTTISLNPGSSYDGGACQLWRLVPAGGGWSRIQLKVNKQYLDADHCSATISLNPGSSYDGGACQLWRLVPGR